MMFWLIVIGIVCYCIFKVYSEYQHKATIEDELTAEDIAFINNRINDLTTAGSSNKVSSAISATMPSDAHAQVEKLAQLIYLVYRDAPYAKNDFAKGSLTFSLQDNGRYQILFWYDWDFSPAKSIIEKQTKLSEGFYFQGDDTLHYETNKVDHTDWFINAMTKEYYLDPVIATLQNNCPGLQITNRRVYQTGFIIEFRYR